ncbi:hypothetical protein [Streptomyces sp. NPDC002676]
MLRILDARTGEPVTAAPARRGLTRVEARASGLDPTSLRVLLTADLLARALELGGTPVWTMLTAPHDQPELRRAATTLSIRPFENAHDLAPGLGEAQVIHVTERDYGDTPGAGPVVSVAPVVWQGERRDGSAGATGGLEGAPGAPGRAADGLVGPDRAPDGGDRGLDGPDRAPGQPRRAPGAPADPATRPAPPAESLPAPHPEPGLASRPGSLPEPAAFLADAGADPAALRLALLSVPRREPVRLDAALLDDAARTLAGWRRDVARWARQRSRPVPDEVRARLRAAWEDDLDVPAVLGVLRDVASEPGLADGARFETYAYADRLLALDLARDLGSLA